MAAKGSVNFNNLVQTIVQHTAFRETFNSILTATNQEQSINIVLIAWAEIRERQGSFYRQLADYLSHVLGFFF